MKPNLQNKLKNYNTYEYCDLNEHHYFSYPITILSLKEPNHILRAWVKSKFLHHPPSNQNLVDNLIINNRVQIESFTLSNCPSLLCDLHLNFTLDLRRSASYEVIIGI
jgi:hypothetical protein